jgi:CRISPR-associated exonuclease Cas4
VDAAPVIPLVVALGLGLLLYLLIGHVERHGSSRLGLDGGVVVAADDSRLRAPTLRSSRLGLVGRPDHLLRSGDALIPVEQKPSARRVQPSHVMQIAAQCLLVEETYGVRPPFGIVVLAGGTRAKVSFTPDLERRLLSTMADMRELVASQAEPGPRWVAPKCQACSFVETCWE